ncbi:2-C-methyl-D-erythritol 4-phosphate cytidylyltransferase [hydrothermal vent metagenome]|uniref:2-C-methyl-D-erythritol 4-phosphate cytidylyltransferase n=1 Tax=hydrothermal vent metagenome TaxID=652676 RepID=A0A3B0UX86_9ZZZZ
MEKFAVIVAGGSGSRMKRGIAKQFIELAGKPILMHTIEVFFNFDKTIQLVLVIPAGQISTWEKLCLAHNFTIAHQIAEGGSTRFHSVKNGLGFIGDEGIVFIHDGVRPLVNQATLNACLEMAVEKGNAIPVLPVTESIRKGGNTNSVAADRNDYFLVQTPQTFHCKLIKDAYCQDYRVQFTDDASVIEAFGESIHLVEGNRENIKITYPEDLEWAGCFL